MPKKKQFDPEELLDTAMVMFWEKGYEATSIRDIVERSGVNQFGIYNLYKDKHELFLAVLDRYRDRVVSQVFGIIEQPDASLPAIEQYFETLVEHHTTTMRAMGCLMANVMAERASENDDVTGRTKQHLDRQLAGFTKALKNAKEKGEIKKDIDIEAMAQYLVVAVQ